MKRRRGQIFEITEGVNKGKHGIAYYDNQRKEFNGKICIIIYDPNTSDNQEPLNTLIDPKKLKRIGFVD